MYQRYLKLAGLTLIAGLLAALLTACGQDKPTVIPTAGPPTATPTPAPAAYLAQVDFDYSDQAETAQANLVNSRPNFPSYAAWTQSNHWFVLVRDSDDQRLRAAVGQNARIFPVSYLAQALNLGPGGVMPSYMLVLNRATVDVKARGAEDVAKLLFNRALGLQVQRGLMIFTLSDDQIYVLVSASYSANQVLALASFGVVELVSVGKKPLSDGQIIATSSSPLLGGLKLSDSTPYTTLVEGSDFTGFQSGQAGAGGLNFQLRVGSQLFDYSRANLGSYTALVFDRQVLSSAQLAEPIRDHGQIIVPHWAGTGGQADMQRFVDLMNANPRQVFKTKEINPTTNFAFSGFNG